MCASEFGLSGVVLLNPFPVIWAFWTFCDTAFDCISDGMYSVHLRLGRYTICYHCIWHCSHAVVFKGRICGRSCGSSHNKTYAYHIVWSFWCNVGMLLGFWQGGVKSLPLECLLHSSLYGHSLHITSCTVQAIKRSTTATSNPIATARMIFMIPISV